MKREATRLALLFIGSLALVLGVIGVFVPLLPTTPFILLAAWCFLRSSPRFHAWLTTHPRFGPIIRDWHERGAIVSARARCGGRWANMSSITMRSAITRGRAISCCSLGVRTSTTRSPFNVASDWADSCVTTIRRQRKKRGTPQRLLT